MKHERVTQSHLHKFTVFNFQFQDPVGKSDHENYLDDDLTG
jgi:hypothetical protein